MRDKEFQLPDFDESSIAAVHLLQGVVYYDETKVWNLVLSYQSRLDTYFGRIGLRLVVDPTEGYAFLRQLEETEMEQVPGYSQLPKLFHRKRLSYDATLLCVLLRDELRRFEDQELSNTRCVVSASELFEQWKMLMPSGLDDMKAKKQLDTALKALEELRYIREFVKDPQEWEIRRVLKARLPVSALEQLRSDLKSAYDRRNT